MRPTRAVASFVGAITIVGGLLVAAAPAALAGPDPNGTPTAGDLECSFYLSGGFTAITSGADNPGSDYPDTFTLTQSPASPTAGQTVSVTLTANTGALNGPATIDAGDEDVLVNAALSTGQTFQLNSENTGGTTFYPPANVPPTNGSNGNEYLGGYTATGSYTAPSSGSNKLTITQVDLLNPIQGANFYCSDPGGTTPTGAAANDGSGPDAAPSNTLNDPTSGQSYSTGPGGPPTGNIGDFQSTSSPAIYQSFTIAGPTVSVTSITNQAAGQTQYARSDGKISFGLSNFSNSDTSFTAALCSSSGTGCDTTPAAHNVTQSVATTSSKNLTISTGAFATDYGPGSGVSTDNLAVVTDATNPSDIPAGDYISSVTSATAAGLKTAASIAAGDTLVVTPISATSTGTLASGSGTGSLTVSGGATSGVREILVTGNTGDTATYSINILTTPSSTPSVTGGGAGTVVNITANNLDPGECNVYFYGYNTASPAGASNGISGESSGPLCASSTGTASGTITVTSPQTQSVGVLLLGITYSPAIVLFQATPFSYSGTSCTADVGNVTGGKCSLIQTLNLTANAGNLSMAYPASYLVTPSTITVSAFSAGATSLTQTSGATPAVGDQLLGTGLASGTTVTAASGSTITISPATSTATTAATSLSDVVPQHISGWSSPTSSQNYAIWNPVSGGLTLPSVTLTGSSQAVAGPMIPVDVSDYRGGSYGWTLTGTFSGLSDGGTRGGDKIAPSALAWVPACTAASNNDAAESGATDQGAAASFASSTVALPLCQDASSAFGASGLSDGDTTAAAGLTLTTPADLAAGSFSGTLTLTLS